MTCITLEFSPYIHIQLSKDHRLLSHIIRSQYVNCLYDNGLYFQGIFMFVMNIYETGRILNMDGVETTHLHNDLWQISSNAKVCTLNFFKFILMLADLAVLL